MNKQALLTAIEARADQLEDGLLAVDEFVNAVLADVADYAAAIAAATEVTVVG
jgi:hypothetical protein